VASAASQPGDALLARSTGGSLHGTVARELGDRVVTMTFSEFGRRVTENVSQGTDHGAAGPMFVVGKHVKGGHYGGGIDLEKLDSGDLAMKVDFRSVYSALLEKHLAIPAEKALKGKFEPLGLFA
jgi:uncharacterized protein (DUF1501 family)